jgi:uncharacterized membrane protein SirB2
MFAINIILTLLFIRICRKYQWLNDHNRLFVKIHSHLKDETLQRELCIIKINILI